MLLFTSRDESIKIFRVCKMSMGLKPVFGKAFFPSQHEHSLDLKNSNSYNIWKAR